MQNVSPLSELSMPNMQDQIGTTTRLCDDVMSILSIRPTSGRAARKRAKTSASSSSSSSLEASTHVVTIPDVILHWASKIRTLVATLDINDGPDLGLRHPPYAFTLPDVDDIVILQDVGEESLDLKLDALQSRWIREEQRERYMGWSEHSSDRAQVIRAANAELTARIGAWNSLAADNRYAAWAASVRVVYLVWGARRIVTLAEELEVWKRSRDAYVAGYNGSLTPVLEHTNMGLSVSESNPADTEEEEEEEEEDDLFAEIYE